MLVDSSSSFTGPTAAIPPTTLPFHPAFELSRKHPTTFRTNQLNGTVAGDFRSDGTPKSIDVAQSLSSGRHDLDFRLWDGLGKAYTAQKTVTGNR
jgi:hypothetical protein